MDLDVRIGGGPSTVRQFLAADLIDHLHIVIAPISPGARSTTLGRTRGTRRPASTLEAVSTPSGVTHVTFTRR